MSAADTFRFLGETRSIRTLGEWNDPAAEKLWLYNLHYFDDLNAEGGWERAEWHRQLIERWVVENPTGRGNGWEPYPSSVRIVNWIKWTLDGGDLSAQALASLAVQVRFLCGQLEFHLLGNHLLANAKALVFAGLFFEGDEARQWLERGLEILADELPEQILGDGGHFELSPQYHSLILEDLLDLTNVARTFGNTLPINFGLIGAMRQWLAVMCHPDGEIAFFNDGAFDGAPRRDTLERYAARLGYAPSQEPPPGITYLEASGYIRLQHDAAVALLDVAPIGPSYLPGHGHADALSFELSVAGQRIVVNSGTSLYGTGPERQRQRGTAAHSTVVVDGADSSEVWGGFRVARRARVTVGATRDDAQMQEVEASHDGFRRLPGHNMHRRRWRLGRGMLEVDDEVTGAFGWAEARFHLHPAIRISETAPGQVRFEGPDGVEGHFGVVGGALRVEPGTWHPRFGTSIPNVCLVARLSGPKLQIRIQWR